MFILAQVRQGWHYLFHCYFVLTGIVNYQSNFWTDEVKVDKSLKRVELTIRRACKANYNLQVPASAYQVKDVDGHICLHSSGTFDVEKLKATKRYYMSSSGYDVFRKLTNYWRMKNADNSLVEIPKWYKPKGKVAFIKRAYTGHVWSDIPTIGILHWADFDMTTGKYDSYIWMTGDITYDSKTGKALYDNKRKVSIES